MWLLNPTKKIDPAATDIANLTEAKQLADGAASKLEKILLKRQRRQGGKKKKN